MNEREGEHNDVVDYRQWLSEPHADSEINQNKRIQRTVAGRVNPDWRPFRHKDGLSAQTTLRSLRLLSQFYKFMVNQSDCSIQENPFEIHRFHQNGATSP